MTAMLVAVDVLLALGLTMRLTRFIVVDDLGAWWVRWPLDGLKHSWQRKHGRRTPWWGKYLDGLTCPFCVGFWIGVAVLGSLEWAGGPGDATDAWRWIAGAFTLNEVAAHLGSRLGDAGYAED